MQVYKDLSRVERAFRSLKTIDLEIRPIRHWTAPRVRAHVFLCASSTAAAQALRRDSATVPGVTAERPTKRRPNARPSGRCSRGEEDAGRRHVMRKQQSAEPELSLGEADEEIKPLIPSLTEQKKFTQ